MPQMPSPIRDSRAGSSQAILNAEAFKWFSMEAAIAGIAYGIQKQSWTLGLIAFAVFGVMIYIPIVNYLFAAGMTYLWGYGAWYISGAMGNEEARIVWTILAAALSGSIHFYSITYARDLNRRD